MSTAAPPEVQAAAEPDVGLWIVARRRVDALKSGDVGSLPVIAALAIITVFFTAKTSVFFTAVNFDNLIPVLHECL